MQSETVLLKAEAIYHSLGVGKKAQSVPRLKVRQEEKLCRAFRKLHTQHTTAGIENGWMDGFTEVDTPAPKKHILKSPL